MRHWAPRLFSTGLLLLLGAVLGHAAEHDGWFKGVFHCHAADVCHGDADAMPCDGAACHSHDAVADADLSSPTHLSGHDSPRAWFDVRVIQLLPALCQAAEFRLPDQPPPLPGEATWIAGWFPLLA